MYKSVFLLTIIFNCTSAAAQTKNERLIISAINEQVAAWNAGDMTRYMNTYWQSDSLMFIGKNIEYGWNYVFKNYLKAYPDTVAMGKLDFDLISVKRLSGIYYSVVGKWHLKRTGGHQKGAFTLIFKKIRNRWLIVQDHSS